MPDAKTEISLEYVEALFHSGRFSDAYKHLIISQEEQADHDFSLLLGIAACGLGKFKQAAHFFCTTQKHHHDAEQHACSEMERYLTSGVLTYEMIIKVIDEALLLTPHDKLLHACYATILQHAGHPTKAIHHLKRYIGENKPDVFLCNLLATFLLEAGKYAIAMKIFSHCEKAFGGNFVLYTNIATLYHIQNQFEHALRYYRKAIQLQPYYAKLRVNYSLCLLKAGFFHQGWIEHEWRLNTPNHTSLSKKTLLPTLTSTIELKDKKILLTQEGGLGDTLMYLRFVALLVEFGADVELWVPESIKGLCQRLQCHPKVRVGGDNVPDFDWHCPFISLPRALNIDPNQFKKAIPYLFADPQKVEKWKNKLPKTDLLKIGIAWKGSEHRNDITAMLINKKKSIPLSKFSSLIENVKNAQFISLQSHYNDPSDRELLGQFNIFNPIDDIETMDDTAAIIANLDVVITVVPLIRPSSILLVLWDIRLF